MLYGYPVAAIADNWLHDCLCQIISSIYQASRAGQAQQQWPAILPAVYRDRLKKKHGLKKRLNAYIAAYLALSEPERELVYTTFENQNSIEDLLACRANCAAITDLPENIQEPIINLFTGSFGLLTDLGIRDSQFKIIYDNSVDKICPFCGYEYFDAPGAPREDLDHFLLITKYPFAGANLSNLVPMGPKCNQNYKGTIDILITEQGVRRKSFYPFGQRNLTLSLVRSQPFAGKDGKIPDWKLDFEPDSDEIITWDTVFHITERYTRDALNPSFTSWLTHFQQWCLYRPQPISSREEILNAMRDYLAILQNSGISDRAFLKAAVFSMLLTHCENGDARLLTFVSDIITGRPSQNLMY